MTQKTIKVLRVEVYFKPPKWNSNTNKADVYHFDDIWSSDKLDLKIGVLRKTEDIDMLF